ncbi:MAG: c-type cytochrome [Bradymonadia bacterium]
MRWALVLSLTLPITLAGCGSDDASTTPTHDGAALYTQYCAFCHGERGEGYLADNANALSHPAFLRTATDDFLRAGIVHGRPGTPMSPWGEANQGPLDDAQVDAIVAHLRSWQTDDPLDVHDEVVEGVAQRGAPVYAARCAGCHGENGEGITALSLTNPWFLATASDGFLQYAITEGREGTAMPAYKDELTGQAIRDVVVWLRSQARDPDAAPEMPYTPDLTDMVINPDGPEPDFTLREDRFVPADQVKAALDAGARVILLDARPTSDYVQSHITGAINLPFYVVSEYAEDLPKDTWIVTYCGCPHAVSGQAYDALAAVGFTRIAVLDEGFYVWGERGYPLD